MAKRKQASIVVKAHLPARADPRRAVAGPRDDSFWRKLAACNELEPRLRLERLREIGIHTEDRDVLGILTKSHFVIPGVTRFECQKCGECCRYARKVAQLTYEPCPFLTAENTCSKHDHRYLVCKWFPFWIYSDPLLGPLLTIKPYCSGYGRGPLVDYSDTLARIAGLSAAQDDEEDGAFVIHEVLLIPGSRDWAFPSRQNIDNLMRFIQKGARTQAVEQSPERPVHRADEVHYAHHYTSGLLGSITDPLVTVAEDGRVTDTNDAACRISRLRREDMVGRPVAALFANGERVAAFLSACFCAGKETASPQRLRLPDETAIPVLLNGSVYRDRSDGMVHGALIGINPVSAAVFSEISKTHQYARGLLEASLDALMVIEKDGTLSDVNEAMVLFSGRSREQLVGFPFHQLFREQEKARQGVERTFREGSVRLYELTVLTPEGGELSVSFNAHVYRDADGEVRGIFAAARDIRERLKMIHELEEAKNYARGLIDCSLDLMVTIDRDYSILDANRAAAALTGRPREALIGTPFFCHFDDPDEAKRGVDSTFADRAVRDYELNLVPASGKPVRVSFNATLYPETGGSAQCVFAVARVMDSGKAAG